MNKRQKKNVKIAWKPGDCNHIISFDSYITEQMPHLKTKLLGFNCEKYDNHILYERMIGAINEEND